METKEFYKYCDILDKKISLFNYSRLSSSYNDILLLNSLSEEVERDIVQFCDHRDLHTSEDEKAIQTYHLKQSQGATLLKAIYAFSDVFIKILLGEVSQIETKSKGEMSLGKFINNFSKEVPMNQQTLLKQISVDKLLPVYCIAVYRNKIIIHHDKTRIMGFYHSGKDRQCRITPYPENGEPRETALGLSFSEDTEKKFTILWDKYCDQILETSKNNYFKKFLFSREEILKQISAGEKIGRNIQIEMLFYNLPIGNYDEICEDRFLINRIAEEGLCESMTRDEIINALDIFIKEIVRVYN